MGITMKAFVIITALALCATGSYGLKCMKNGVSETCPANVKVCKMTTKYMDATHARLDNPGNKGEFDCGDTGDKMEDCKKDGTKNKCFCDQDNCNDIEQCRCDGADKTRTANKAKNGEASAEPAGHGAGNGGHGAGNGGHGAEPENSAHGIVSKASLTVLAAFVAWGLL